MAARSRQQTEAAGMAADRRSLSRVLCMLSAWVAGAALVLAGASLRPARADQHGSSRGVSAHGTPHFSASHYPAPRFSAQRFSGQRVPAQHGYAGPGRMSAPQPYRQFQAGAPYTGNRNAYAAPGYGTRVYGNERALAVQPGRPFAPAQNAQQNNVNRNFAGGRPQQGSGQAHGEHLGSWMRQHQNQSPADQERALHQEPGFNRLPPQQQQNLINRLHQLNQMQPLQRERTMERVENLERLSPERRQAVRSSAQQLGAMPPDRRRMVQKAFRDLRDMPPEQRQAVINSPEFAGQFSAQERSIVGNLLAVEPYQHPGPNASSPQYGKQF